MKSKVEIFGGVAEVICGNVKIIDIDDFKEKGYSNVQQDQEIKNAIEEHQNVVIISGGCGSVEKGEVEIVDND